MEFRRIHDLPPYVFATVDQLKRELRRDGRDVIDLGFGNPDIPSPADCGREAGEAALQAGQPPLLGEPRPAEPARRRSASATRKVFGVELDPEQHVVSTIGAKEGLAHLMWVLRRAPATASSCRAPPTRSTSSRRASPAPPSSHARIEDGDVLGAIEEALEAAEPTPRVVIASFPHNPTTAVATPELMQRLVDLAREHEFILVHDFAYADIAFDGHVPPSVLQAEGALDCAVELYSPHEVLLDGRLARGLHARPRPTSSPRSRSSSRYLDYGTFQPIQIAVDRGAARGRRLPGRGLRDLPQPPRRALLRPRPRRLARRAAERDDVRLGADPGAARASSARSSSRSSSRARPTSRSAPASASAPGGDGHVRFALVENEQRISQATRKIRKLLQALRRSRRHRSFRRGADVARVLREHALRVARLGRRPVGERGAASSSSGTLEVERAALDVEHDRVAVAHGGDRAAARTPPARCGRPSGRASRPRSGRR